MKKKKNADPVSLNRPSVDHFVFSYFIAIPDAVGLLCLLSLGIGWFLLSLISLNDRILEELTPLQYQEARPFFGFKKVVPSRLESQWRTPTEMLLNVAWQLTQSLKYTTAVFLMEYLMR